ncbi:NAD-dependent epimerase/dehydratase family protein [Candidatus Njordibacter sp. Uisw_002]|uniref:NAD-dependent epimerase/dehydratase family protein n=1 Tax=Candidatus Njordibacter sp. Uisw_002 TaxID=3230971 RepID=UPI003D589D75
MKILVTGSAGFIGFHLVRSLLHAGHHVTGIDNLNDYYDPGLKRARLSNLDQLVDECAIVSSYSFLEVDLSDMNELKRLFLSNSFEIVINLAAQAGVRYSIDNPKSYIDSNLVGFVNLLECCRHANIEHLLFASSSSVYGMNKKQPFSASDSTDFPISLYAATKKSNELLAHSYSHLFGLACTGLRFFTVYGPYGRPDMAYYSFTKAIDSGIPIDVYNNGDMKRDFTYIDDIVAGIVSLIGLPPVRESNEITNADAAFQILNIGNNNPVSLGRFIGAIESALGKKAIKNFLPMQPGDVPVTYADIEPLQDLVGFSPTTEIEVGIKNFVDWYISSK